MGQILKNVDYLYRILTWEIVGYLVPLYFRLMYEYEFRTERKKAEIKFKNLLNLDVLSH